MSDYSRLIEIFEELVAFQTVTGAAEPAAECLSYIEKLLVPYGLYLDRYSSNGFEALVATTRRTKKPTVFLQAHLDVVPAHEDMFHLEREATKLRGRGAFDMKYAAACYLNLVEELAAGCAAYDFGLMFTTDEEYGGENGVKHLLEQDYSCDVCVVPDGGDNWRVEIATKGVWMVDAAAHGKAAHGSRPWEGDSAVTRLIGFVQEAQNLAPGTSHTDTTLVATQIHAGSARNQVPDEATASLDIRFLNTKAYETIQKQLADLAKRHDVELTTFMFADATQLDASQPMVQEWERVVSEVRGLQAADGYALSFGASDARYFAARGIPAIVTRPDGGGMHGDTEWIDEPGLYQFYDCVRKYVDAVALPAVKPLDETAPTEYNEAQLPETVAAVKT